MRKSFTAMVLVIGMALGAGLTVLVSPVGVAGALVGAPNVATNNHQTVLQAALSTLVGNHTISQSQADAVTNQVHSEMTTRMGRRPGLGKRVLVQVAGLLKMDPQALVAELRTGKSIADVAKEKGVDPNTLANELVGSFDNAINARVKAGKLKQEWASDMQANLPARVQTFINRKWGRHLGTQVAPKTTAPTTSVAPPPSTTTTTGGTSATGGTAATTTTSGG